MTEPGKLNIGLVTTAALLWLSMIVLAQGGSGSHGAGARTMGGYGPMSNPGLSHTGPQGQNNSIYGRTTAEAARNKHRKDVSPTPTVSPKPTPKGHHYGWQKGKHNPHASPTP